jgi:hypothetical protein
MGTSVRVLAVVAALGLSACGGGGGSSSGAVPQSGAGPSSTHSKATAALSFFIPSGGAAAHKRRALPAGTGSVVITVSNADGSSAGIAPVVANVSATSSGCTTASDGIQCTETVTAPLGSDLFGVVSYSGANASGNVLAQGNALATISSTSASVAVTTSTANTYVAENLEGGVIEVQVDHSADTFQISGFPDGDNISGTVTALPQGDLKFTVTSPTNDNGTQGTVGYARELPGATLNFMATNTASPPVTGVLSTGADWGIGTGLGSCPTGGGSVQVVAVIVGGPAYSSSTSKSVVTGTATFASGSSPTLSFNGTSYTIGGASGGAQSGNGTCSGGIFVSTDPGSSSTQGNVALGTFGVLIVGSGNQGNQSMNDTNGGFGFAYTSAVAPSASTLAALNYDGFFGGYKDDGTTNTEAGPLTVSPGSGGALQVCPYSDFEAGTVAPTSGCGSVTFSGSQPVPGVLFGTLVEGSAMGSPGTSQGVVFTASQITGKWVVFGATSTGGAIALTEH